jgi:fatty acid synthase
MDASQPHARSGEPNFEYRRWLSSAPPGEEVVISGMSGRLPDSRTIHEFRDKLFSKTDMVNDRRWKLDHPEIPQRGSKIPTWTASMPDSSECTIAKPKLWTP